MVGIGPFRGLRFHTRHAGELSRMLCPPYDVITPAERAELVRRHPHNLVRVEVPAGPNRYQAAARALARWRREGVLRQDPVPAVYLHEHTFRVPGTSRRTTRLTLWCRLRISPPGRGPIRPHERTLTGPREDRVRLLRACRANLSPVFGLYADPAGTIRRMLRRAARAVAAQAACRGPQGRHRLWRLDDPGLVKALASGFERKTIVIADGHHRYEAAWRVSRETRAPGSGWILAGLTALEDPGLVVLATHRALPAGVCGPDGWDAFHRDFTVRRVRNAGRMAAWAARGGVPLTLGVIRSGGQAAFLRAREEAASVSDRLETVILQDRVLNTVFGLNEEDLRREGRIRFTHDAREAVRWVHSGACGWAFLLPPTPAATVRVMAQAGIMMPQKSTYFFPKLPSGLVIRAWDDHVEG